MNHETNSNIPNFEKSHHFINEPMVPSQSYVAPTMNSGYVPSALLEIGDDMIAVFNHAGETQIHDPVKGEPIYRVVNLTTGDSIERRSMDDEVVTTFGRSDLGLNSLKVSRNHFSIIPASAETGWQLLIKDENSTNGTKITTDQEKIEDMMLSPEERDRIQLLDEQNKVEAAERAAAKIAEREQRQRYNTMLQAGRLSVQAAQGKNQALIYQEDELADVWHEASMHYKDELLLTGEKYAITNHEYQSAAAVLKVGGTESLIISGYRKEVMTPEVAGNAARALGVVDEHGNIGGGISEKSKFTISKINRYFFFMRGRKTIAREKLTAS